MTRDSELSGDSNGTGRHNCTDAGRRRRLLLLAGV